MADTPAEAVDGAEVIVTMLADGDAVIASMEGADGALSAIAPEAVWAQMSTVGLAGGERCAELARHAELAYVDAPVLGTREPAEKGKLIVLASGEESDLARCRPVFDGVGEKVLELGAAGAGTRLKLVVNHWLLGLVENVAETIALAQRLGVEPSRFLETIDGGPLNVPYAQLKGRAILDGDLSASFALKLAHKDARLVLDAARRHDFDAAPIATVAERMEQAIDLGHGEEDMAATYWASADGASGGDPTGP